MKKHLLIGSAILSFMAFSPAIVGAMSPDRDHGATAATNLETALSIVRAAENENIQNVMEHFREDAVFAQPFSPRGSDFSYDGFEEIQSGFQGIFDSIEPVSFSNKEFTVSQDGKTIFMEAQGDMKLAENGRDYNNFYVFRVDFDDEGKVERLTEYYNSLYLAETFNLLQPNQEQ